MGKQWKQWLTLLFGAPKSLHMVIAAMKLKDTYSMEGKVWPNYTEIQRIIKDYYQQLYANKMDNLEEMDKFLEK